MYGAVYNNFLVNDMHIDASALGGLESLREVPGFLTVVWAALTVRFPVSRVASAALFVMGIGLAAISGGYAYWQLIAAGMVWSVGFHLFNPLNNGLVLSATEPKSAGRALGWIGGIGSAGALAGMAVVFVFIGVLGRRAMFIPTGAIVLVGAVSLLFMHDRGGVQRPRLVIRKRYWIYYALTLLDGSRRQVFSTFAVFLLVKVYSLDVREITALLIFNSLVTTVVTPRIGRLIDRHGERPMLVLNYVLLTFLFAGYALVHSLVVLGVLYCVDNALFAFGVGISSYLGKMAPRTDVTPSLAMGATFNHVAAVSVPILGGLLWQSLGYQVTFFAGAATCILSVLVALRMQRKSDQWSAGVLPSG